MQKDLNEFKVKVFSRLSRITDTLVDFSSQVVHSFECWNVMNKKKTTDNLKPLPGSVKRDDIHQQENSEHGVPPSNRDNGTGNVGANILENVPALSSLVKEFIKVIMRISLGVLCT